MPKRIGGNDGAYSVNGGEGYTVVDHDGCRQSFNGVGVKGSGQGDGGPKTLKETMEPKFHGNENQWVIIGEALSVRVIISQYPLDEMMEPMMQSVVVTEPWKSQ